MANVLIDVDWIKFEFKRKKGIVYVVADQEKIIPTGCKKYGQAKT